MEGIIDVNNKPIAPGTWVLCAMESHHTPYLKLALIHDVLPDGVRAFTYDIVKPYGKKTNRISKLHFAQSRMVVVDPKDYDKELIDIITIASISYRQKIRQTKGLI